MTKGDESERIAHKCITSLAGRYTARLPYNSKYEHSDLLQEGWIIYWKIMTTKRIRWEGNEFPALLRMAIGRRYKNILREERQPSRAAVQFDNSVVDGAVDEVSIDPECWAMVAEAFTALSLVNNDIVQYLVQGTSISDMGLIRYIQRQRKRGHWGIDNMHYRWTPELVKLIFNFDASSFHLCGYI